MNSILQLFIKGFHTGNLHGKEEDGILHNCAYSCVIDLFRGKGDLKVVFHRSPS